MAQNLSNEEVFRSLAQHYQRKAAELEEGLVVANAQITRLKTVINELEVNNRNIDPDDVRDEVDSN